MRLIRLGSHCALMAVCTLVAGCGETAKKADSKAAATADMSSRYSKSAEYAQPASKTASREGLPGKRSLDLRVDSAKAAGEAIKLPDLSGAATPAPHPAIELQPDEGRGPGRGGDKYAQIVENAFRAVSAEPYSTFSIDVDTASYSKVRMYLSQTNMLPPPDAVRLEELINYFDFSYAPPKGNAPFAVHTEVGACPWQPEHKLVKIGLKGREIDRKNRPDSNLVFLVDVSGSMNQPNKLPLVKRGLSMLARQLGDNDRVSLVVYAGAAGMVLPATRGTDQATILHAIERLQAGGSTNGGQGIQLAYTIARENLISGGVNRVLLCTDGDFNVGTTSSGELVRMAETHAKAGVFLTVLGFGMGNHNDAMLEQLSDKANGNYAFVDTEGEAAKVLVEQMSGTLVTIAKDVKIQVEFNPLRVANYRLLGYENRILANQDFNDDKKDAGEIGAGHVVTALYEITPAGPEASRTTLASATSVDPLKYQAARVPSEAADSKELLTVKLRYKQPSEDESTLLEVPVNDDAKEFALTSPDYQFAAAVAGFGMQLRNSEHKGNWTYAAVLEVAQANVGSDRHGYRAEFVDLVRRARGLARE